MDIEFTPIFFPTKVAIIDDDPEYLSQVKLLLDDNLACQLFTSPSQALVQMQASQDKNDEFAQQCASHVAANLDSDQPVDHDHTLHQLVNDQQRFDRFSVMVVDYAMPEMSGVEVCQQIRDPWIKKILITGKASSQVAVQAFNDGVIDYFIQKEEPDVEVRLNAAINNLSQQYFTEICVARNNALKDKIPYLFDVGFVVWFKNLCREHNIVEFYLKKKELINEFMMVNKQGQLKYLFVQTAEQARAQYEVEEANQKQYLSELKTRLADENITAVTRDELNATANKSTHIREQLMQAIDTRSVISYFSSQCEYDDRYLENWQRHVYPATRYADYTYALVDVTDLPDYEPGHEVNSYESFLKNYYAGGAVN